MRSSVELILSYVFISRTTFLFHPALLHLEMHLFGTSSEYSFYLSNHSVIRVIASSDERGSSVKRTGQHFIQSKKIVEGYQERTTTQEPQSHAIAQSIKAVNPPWTYPAVRCIVSGDMASFSDFIGMYKYTAGDGNSSLRTCAFTSW